MLHFKPVQILIVMQSDIASSLRPGRYQRTCPAQKYSNMWWTSKLLSSRIVDKLVEAHLKKPYKELAEHHLAELSTSRRGKLSLHLWVTRNMAFLHVSAKLVRYHRLPTFVKWPLVNDGDSYPSSVGSP
jgi:hypothetical protein